jgi:clan AA aspartic protease
MITGTVNAAREARIRFPARDAAGQDHAIEAIIDTGFDGELTLSARTIAALGCPQTAWSRVTLADGTQSRVPLHELTIVWNGQPRVVEASAALPVALVGTALLHGHEVRIEFKDGGTVTITPLP